MTDLLMALGTLLGACFLIALGAGCLVGDTDLPDQGDPWTVEAEYLTYWERP